MMNAMNHDVDDGESYVSKDHLDKRIWSKWTYMHWRFQKPSTINPRGPHILWL